MTLYNPLINTGYVDYLSVVCGKTYTLSKWLDYIEQLPVEKHPGNLIVVNNSTDVEYQQKLFTGLGREPIRSQFNTVNVIYGPGRFVPPAGVSWRDPAVNIGKHNSTCDAYNIGFSRCSNELVVTVDDDTFLQPGDIDQLIKQISWQKDVGAISGVYLTKPWGGVHTPDWETDRTVVMSIEKDDWRPVKIDQVYQRGLIDIGFCGTGATVWRLDAVKSCLPMFTESGENGNNLGPDGVLCRSLREHGYKIQAETGLLAQHYGKDEHDDMVEVGITTHKVREQFARDRVAIACYSESELMSDRIGTILNLQQMSYDMDATIMMYWVESNEVLLTREIEEQYPEVIFKTITQYDESVWKVSGELTNRHTKINWLKKLISEELTHGEFSKIITMIPGKRYNIGNDKYYSDDNHLYYMPRRSELQDKQLNWNGII
jgi:hypothetical protein